VPPTVLTDVPATPGPVCREEVFGPVAVLSRWSPSTRASMPSTIPCRPAGGRVYRGRRQLVARVRDPPGRAGSYSTTHPTYRIDHMPYGGVKDSGLGREGILYAIEEMTESRLFRDRSAAVAPHAAVTSRWTARTPIRTLEASPVTSRPRLPVSTRPRNAHAPRRGPAASWPTRRRPPRRTRPDPCAQECRGLPAEDERGEVDDGERVHHRHAPTSPGRRGPRRTPGDRPRRHRGARGTGGPPSPTRRPPARSVPPPTPSAAAA